MKRNRALYALGILSVIAIGLLSRRHPDWFPQAFGKYPGDALWAMMVFLGFGLVFSAKRTAMIGLATLTFSCAIEFSQAYHASWIDSIRATTAGHLVLGSGFSWADIAAYSVGILLACLFEIGLYKVLSSRRS